MRTAQKLVIFLSLFYLALADIETVNGVFKTSCFSDDNNGECENSRIKICHDFYACDLVVEFQSSVKRIGFINGHILVAEGSETYSIDEKKMEAKVVKKAIPPLNEFVDRNGNRYYSGEGKTYVSHKESGKEIEIVTSGEYSFNQLALDDEAGILFILTFPSANNEERLGKLYGAIIAPLNIVDGKIIADVVEGENNFTALAVIGGLDRILLGVKTQNGNKLVKLARQKDDPCSVLRSPQNELLNVIKDTQKRVLEIFDVIVVNSNRRYEADLERQLGELRLLEEQNGQCQIQLQQITIAYESYSSRITSFHTSILRQNTLLFDEINNSTATVTNVEPEKKKEDGHHNYHNYHNYHNNHNYHHGQNWHHYDNKECLPATEIANMRASIKQFQDRESQLMERLRKYETDLNNLITSDGVATPNSESSVPNDSVGVTI